MRKKSERKEVLFPLIDELDNSKPLFLAKAVLDDFTRNVPDFSENDSEMIRSTLIQDLKLGTAATWKEYYNATNLSSILRYHAVEGMLQIIVRLSSEQVSPRLSHFLPS